MADRRVGALIVGGGAAAAACAESLHEGGFGEGVLLVGREPDPPYERPPCSKEYLAGKQDRDACLLHDADWYSRNGIELATRTSVMKLDTTARTATLSTKEVVEFGVALLATGANVRRLRVDGAQLSGIHYLRTLGTSDAIRADADQAERVVLIGGSYIACEVAATLTARGQHCTLVMLEDAPLSTTFGAAAGAFFGDVLRSHGVELVTGDGLERLEGGERVERVVTASGRELPADMVVMGTGAMPDVLLARAAGLALGESGGVACAAHLETSAPGVFAAGDMCEWDSELHEGPARIEHFEVAQRAGPRGRRGHARGAQAVHRGAVLLDRPVRLGECRVGRARGAVGARGRARRSRRGRVQRPARRRRTRRRRAERRARRGPRERAPADRREDRRRRDRARRRRPRGRSSAARAGARARSAGRRRAGGGRRAGPAPAAAGRAAATRRRRGARSRRGRSAGPAPS